MSKYVAPPAAASSGSRGFLLMRELSRLGYESVIITSDSNRLARVPVFEGPWLHQDLEGVEVWWLHTLQYSVAKSLRRILSWIDFEWRLLLFPKRKLPRPDAIIVSSLSLLTVLSGFLLRKRFGCRLIFEIRDIWPLSITEEGGFGKRNPLVILLSMVEKFGYRQADVIVGTMPNLGEHVSLILGRPKPTYCIPMGVDDFALAPSEPLPEGYAENYIPKGKFIVVHAGTIGITNALDTLFHCAEAMRNNENIHFLIVGDGDLKQRYQAQYGHLHNLTFAPRVDKRIVQAVLACCDLPYFSVHPSAVWKYGQSLNKVVDYMLSGKPVVASYTGFPSMINEAECGSYVPAGDVDSLKREILRYAEMTTEERETIGRRGRNWILKHRNYQTLALKYADLLFAPLAG